MEEPTVTTITLEKKQNEFLDFYCSAFSTSKAAVIRRSIDDLMEQHQAIAEYAKNIMTKSQGGNRENERNAREDE